MRTLYLQPIPYYMMIDTDRIYGEIFQSELFDVFLFSLNNVQHLTYLMVEIS